MPKRPKYLLDADTVQDALHSSPDGLTALDLVKKTRLAYTTVINATLYLRKRQLISWERQGTTLRFFWK